MIDLSELIYCLQDLIYPNLFMVQYKDKNTGKKVFEYDLLLSDALEIGIQCAKQRNVTFIRSANELMLNIQNDNSRRKAVFDHFHKIDHTLIIQEQPNFNRILDFIRKIEHPLQTWKFDAKTVKSMTKARTKYKQDIKRWVEKRRRQMQEQQQAEDED